MWHDREHLAGVTLAVVALAACALWHSRSLRVGAADAVATADRLGAEGAAAAAERTYLAMTGRALDGPVHATPEQAGVGASTRRLWRTWTTSASGSAAGVFVFEAASGELVYASVSRGLCAVGQPVRTPRQAAARGWDWMGRIGAAAQSREWHLREAPTLGRRYWEVTWTGTDRWVLVSLMPTDGAIVVFYSSRCFSVPLARRRGPVTSTVSVALGPDPPSRARSPAVGDPNDSRGSLRSLVWADASGGATGTLLRGGHGDVEWRRTGRRRPRRHGLAGGERDLLSPV